MAGKPSHQFTCSYYDHTRANRKEQEKITLAMNMCRTWVGGTVDLVTVKWTEQ